MRNKRIIPYKLNRADPEIMNVEKAFKSVFGSSANITTANIKAGKTSAVLYVPREFKDRIATVIIWDKPVKYYEDLIKEDTDVEPQVG